ncbi:MAG: extracellular solute-binding protein [Treponema sp.]|jgi:putative aldouronate transport system substrate-binding protein|nr:extracellular solute-binding protein [Treponema sp.]
MRKIFLVSAILLFGIGLIFAGGTRDNQSQVSGGAGTFGEKMEISLAMWDVQDGFNDSNAKNDTIYNELASKFNITIRPVQVTWNDWMEKFRLWAASNQLPDLFASDASSGEYRTWATQGVIKALPDDLSRFPNIQQVMSLPSVTPHRVNGKFYKFPRMTYLSDTDWVNDRNILYRKDWARQAGWDRQPESFEEFMAMCKAVQAQHPGVAGLSINHKGYLQILQLGIFPEGSHGGNWVKDTDGLWKPCWATDSFGRGVAQLHTLYEQGILDRDLALLKNNEGDMKFMSGQAFAVLSGHVYWIYEDAFKAANPGITSEDAIGLINMWPSGDGKRYYFSETPYWSETMFQGRMTDEKMERALYMLDYMYSDEYQLRKSMGIENVDYKVENGQYISLLSPDTTLGKKYPITDKIGALSAWGQWLPLTGKQLKNPDPYVDYTDRLWLEHYNYIKATAVPTPINYDIRLMSTPAKDKASQLNSEMENDMVQVIMGRRDALTAWREVIRSYGPRGLTDAINEVNARAKELGIQ